MDHRAHERERPALHGMVIAARALVLATALLSLAAGIAGGLLRAGVMLPAGGGADWLAQAALAHAALMICGFMGTVIGVERAVAVRLRWALLAPLGSGLAGLALLAGRPAAGGWLLVGASMLFVAVNIQLLLRQRAAHTALLLGGALAWLAGNLAFAGGGASLAALPWWFAFLVLTVAAERLEMTRLMRRRPGVQLALELVLAALAAGAALSAFAPRAGGVLYGAALFALAAWLAAFDIARRTVRAGGLARYMALCLLGGYAWLAVAGAAWAATALGLPLRDVALHALGLGFIVSMMMGHAPVILPAVARVKLQFGNAFYVPLAALHLSLLLRLGAGWNDMALRAIGASLNAVAIALFAATVAGAALAWRHRHGPGRARENRS
ncbi:hypothetical protein ACFPOE_10145 [Caenimonas terrae]|uniref:NnrS family protein n=1 Tax=Caenimonas terrae TaxID=696074 RepID=A0ABW0ND20_9BURK